jgi:hypothetical protein
VDHPKRVRTFPTGSAFPRPCGFNPAFHSLTGIKMRPAAEHGAALHETGKTMGLFDSAFQVNIHLSQHIGDRL